MGKGPDSGIHLELIPQRSLRSRNDLKQLVY
jgi:hypothetical protein